VTVAGRISTADAAEAILQAGQADLVSIGRALHADQEWPQKVLTGKSPRPCIACNQGCIDSVHTQLPIWCVANPVTSQTVPTPVDSGSGDWRTFTVGEASFGGSADAAIREGYAAGLGIS
jgi:hypothetical protein